MPICCLYVQLFTSSFVALVNCLAPRFLVCKMEAIIPQKVVVRAIPGLSVRQVLLPFLTLPLLSQPSFPFPQMDVKDPLLAA